MRQSYDSKRYMHPHVFIGAALFTIAKTWKQPKWPVIDDGIKKMWYINTGDYYSAVKIRIMLFVATWMDLDIITLSEVKSERQMSFDTAYIWI